jgi:5-(carboxyamino)imidazole ribonucleotide synthase
MFAHAAQRLGFHVVTLSPTADAPAAQAADASVVGPPDHLPTLRDFAARVQAVTVEFENVSAPALRWLEQSGRPTRPGWRTVRICQNRLREKTFLRSIGVPTAPWAAVRSEHDLLAAPARVGLPLILKTAGSGYDGKGQVRVEAAGDALESAWAALNRVPCVAEGLVRFAAELSVVSARGSFEAYPPCWNRHDRHILDTSVCPAPVGPHVTAEARRLAALIARELGTVGVLTVEFFMTRDGALIVNELAPRPHNSGHLTIEAATASQFEQQARALAGWPLAPCVVPRPAAMANLLGDLWHQGEPRWSAALAADPALSLHLYGKKAPGAGRKMGHITAVGPDAETALIRALHARESLQPKGPPAAPPPT